MVKTLQIFSLISLFLFFSLPAFAQQKEIDVTLDNTEISLGSSIRMDMVFYDAEGMPAPTIPGIDGLKISYLRSTDAISRIGSRTMRGKRHTYIIIPERPGTFKIGPLSFMYDDVEYKLKKIDILITSGSSRPADYRAETESEEEFRAKENAFLIIASDKDTIYVNEIFQIAAALYYKDLQITDIEYPSVSHEGFSMGQFKAPQASRKQIKGYDYRIITFTNSAFAIRPGDLKLGPAKISCSVYMPGTAGPSSAKSDGIQKNRPLGLESTARNITVLPLPHTDKPESFRGAVGDFQFSLDVQPKGYIKTGEAVTILTTVSGKGNFAAVSAPVIKENKDFIFYSPSIENETDAYKSFKQVIIPKSSFVKEIPQIEFSFFNPKTAEYIELNRGPIPIQVFETEKEKSPSIAEGRDKIIPDRVEQEPIGEGIIYIKEATPKFQVKGRRLYRDKTFLLLQLLPLFLYLSTAFLYKRHRRFKEDIRYARAKYAQKKAKIGLRQAYSVLNSGNAEKFYASIFECIQEYFGNKFNLPQAGITSDSVEKLLKFRNIQTSIIIQVRGFFDRCYLAKFTPYKYEKKDMLDMFETAKMIIKYCGDI
jgi:hypothetical protein